MKHYEPFLDPHLSTKRASRDDFEMREFFLRFAGALTQGDPKQIASHWCVPSFVIADALNLAMTSTREIENFFSGTKRRYISRGIFDAQPDIQNVQWVTEHLAVVDVRWPYLDDQGQEMGAESSTYTLKADDSGEIKILVALMKGTE